MTCAGSVSVKQAYFFFSLSMCAWYKCQCVSVLVSLSDYSHSLTPVQAPDWTETNWSLRSQHLLSYHLESRNWHRSDARDGEDVKKEQRRKPVEVAQLAYELYIKTVWMTVERQEWVEAVQSHSMCQRLFFFFFLFCLLTSAVRQPVAQSDTLCS